MSAQRARTITRPGSTLEPVKHEDWRIDAVCLDRDPDLWHPIGKTYEVGKAICKDGCPVRAECLAYALSVEGDRAADSRWGVWGGLDPQERAALYRRQRRYVGLKP